MNLLSVMMLVEAAAEVPEAGPMSLITTMVLPMVLLFGVMYFVMIRPQRKREKEVESMRSNLEIGDEIITSGGIIGRVVNIQEDYITIETGTSRSKIRLARWAVQSNNTIKDDTPESK